jgi:hypothetical protein
VFKSSRQQQILRLAIQAVLITKSDKYIVWQMTVHPKFSYGYMQIQGSVATKRLQPLTASGIEAFAGASVLSPPLEFNQRWKQVVVDGCLAKIC